MWTGFDQLFFFQNTPRKSCLLSLQQQCSTGSSAGRTLGQRTLEVSAIFTQPGLTKWLMNDTPMSQVTLHGITRHSLLFVYQLMRSALSFCRVIFGANVIERKNVRRRSMKRKSTHETCWVGGWVKQTHAPRRSVFMCETKSQHWPTLTYIDKLRTSM